MTTLASRQELLALAQGGQTTEAVAALRAGWPDSMIDLALDGVLTGWRFERATEDPGGTGFAAWQNNLGKTIAVWCLLYIVTGDSGTSEISVGLWNGVGAFNDGIINDIVADDNTVATTENDQTLVADQQWVAAYRPTGAGVGVDARLFVLYQLEDE